MRYTGKCKPEKLQILALFTKWKMSFGEYLNCIINSCKIKRILIRKLQTFYQENHLLLYESCIRPCCNYGDVICDQALNKNFQETVQFNPMLAIFGVVRGSSKEKHYHDLGLESFYHG